MFTPKYVRRAGLLSAFGGGVLVPYALTKGHLSSRIVTAGWQLGGLSPVQTARLFHVMETVPLVLVAVGLLGLDARVGTKGLLADAGRSTVLVGFGLTVLTHLGEHLLPPLTVPALTGGANWFMWGYYLSWLVLYAGFAIYGTALVLSPVRAGGLPWLFVAVPPLAVTVGLAVVVADVFTLAGSFRLFLGLTWVLAGGWLWRAPGAPSPTSTGEQPGGYGTGDR